MTIPRPKLLSYKCIYPTHRLAEHASQVEVKSCILFRIFAFSRILHCSSFKSWIPRTPFQTLVTVNVSKQVLRNVVFWDESCLVSVGNVDPMEVSSEYKCPLNRGVLMDRAQHAICNELNKISLCICTGSTDCNKV